jgi:hypothetical protein
MFVTEPVNDNQVRIVIAITTIKEIINKVGNLKRKGTDIKSRKVMKVN